VTNDELKAIYEYMKDIKWELFPKPIYVCGKYLYGTKPLGSNSAWECVQEMERKGDWNDFLIHCFNVAEKLNWIWLYNPTNFFDCFGKWCLERRGK
jgi:hypothetical protein